MTYICGQLGGGVRGDVWVSSGIGGLKAARMQGEETRHERFAGSRPADALWLGEVEGGRS